MFFLTCSPTLRILAAVYYGKVCLNIHCFRMQPNTMTLNRLNKIYGFMKCILFFEMCEAVLTFDKQF